MKKISDLKLKMGQTLIDSTGFKCEIVESGVGKILVQYEGGARWTYTAEDFDNGIIKLK